MPKPIKSDYLRIPFSKIDTNKNGYADGCEATLAKAKGVKNVWTYMTELDYVTSTTREQKLNLIEKHLIPNPYDNY